MYASQAGSISPSHSRMQSGSPPPHHSLLPQGRGSIVYQQGSYSQARKLCLCIICITLTLIYILLSVSKVACSLYCKSCYWHHVTCTTSCSKTYQAHHEVLTANCTVISMYVQGTWLMCLLVTSCTGCRSGCILILALLPLHVAGNAAECIFFQ